MPSIHASSVSGFLPGLDDAKPRAIQLRTFALCALVTMLDGIDNQSIGVVAPLMSKDLGLDKTAMGTIFSLTQVGATAGALLFGPFGDRFGRKPAIALSVAIMSVFTLLTAIVPAFGLLLLTRFVAGLGLAGVFSSALALTSEYAPGRLRGTLVSVVYAGYPAGAALGGIMAAAILAHYDWRIVLYMGSLMGLVTLILIGVWLPESIRFLMTKGGRGAHVDGLLGELGIDRNAVADRITPDATTIVSKASLWSVFQHGLAPLTLLLCLLNFFVSATTKIMVVWFPSILAENGFTVSHAALAQASFNVGCLVAMMSAGWLVDHFGVLRVIVPALLLDAVCVAALGMIGTDIVPTMAGAALVGAFIGIGGSGAQAMASRLFAVEMRSTGIGWGTSASRFGQVLSPLLVAMVLTEGVSMTRVYIGLASSPLLAGVVATVFVLVSQRRNRFATS